MGVTLVREVLWRAEVILQDEQNVRWTKKELLYWLNDAQLAIVNRRPDSNVKNVIFTCEADTQQMLPIEAIRLIRVLRNVKGLPIREIDIKVLDDQVSHWHNDREVDSVQHYAYPFLNPNYFYLYPSPVAGHQVEIIYSYAPETIDGWEDDETITLDDAYLNPILDWMLYRAYSKDSDYSANSQRGVMHLNAFNAGIGEKMQADMMVNQA